MADGSSPAKLPGISLDNTAYNTIYGNIVRDNYGSGIKAVRSAFSNTILCNQIIHERIFAHKHPGVMPAGNGVAGMMFS